MVCDCLSEHGVRFDWDRTPGSPILATVAGRLLDIHPKRDSSRDASTEDYEAYRVPLYPDEAFDNHGNPVRLLNLATLRDLEIHAPGVSGQPWRPCLGDRVKLGFLVQDAIAPYTLRELGEGADAIQIEAMWVEVTKLLGHASDPVYRGELLGRPVWIDPTKLRIGSPVLFTAENVYPVEARTKRHAHA